MIRQIIIMDDRETVISTPEELKKFKERISTCLKKEGFECSDDISIKKYGWKLTEKAGNNQTVLDEQGQKIEVWYPVEKNTLQDRTIIFCDYSWCDAREAINARDIYDSIKDNPLVTICFYTTLLYEEAQEWVDKLRATSPKCKLISEVLTSDSDFTDFITSTEEAIEDGWNRD